MGKKEDWEELEKWQREQDAKIKETEREYTNKFNKKDISGAKIFSRIFNMITSSVSTVIVVIIVLVILLALMYIYISFSTWAPPNTIKNLEQIYRGEEFEILEDYSDINGKGLYKISLKSNKNIQFTAYNGGFGVKNDYSAQRFKYYIENCEDKSLLEGFNIEESVEIYENQQFLKYNVNIWLEDYEQLEEQVEKVCNLVKYLISKDEKMYEYISIINWDIDYYFSIECDTELSLEKEIYEAKYEYMKTLKENNNQKELNKIDQEEINEIWKPKFLLLYINGKQMKLYNDGEAIVFYDTNDKKYHMSGTNVILEQIEQIEILEKSKLTGNVKKIKYNNKEYDVEQSSSNGNNKDDVVYGGGTLEEFLENFDSEVIYDYDNEKVYVTIK